VKIAIIGGGAAGFFSAIKAKENHSDSRVVIFEKSQKLLSKVLLSGGGVVMYNACDTVEDLCKAYQGAQIEESLLYFQ
jgi:predicted flavoprotein YhiN